MASPVQCPTSLRDALLGGLRRDYGFEAFRPGQLEVLEATLAGRDVLAVLPTGAGKSLCYQLASRFLPRLTVVVSPLIALMKDQVDKMQARGDLGGTHLCSALSPAERRERLAEIYSGRYRLVYVSPEALRNRVLLESLAARGVSLLVIDEAHCISSWGHDFRPDYLALSEARASLGGPAVLAMTATATVRVQHDIVQSLGLVEAARVVLPFDRPGLELGVLHCHGANEKRSALRRLLAEAGGAAIVYTGRRQRAETLAAAVVTWGYRAAAYHAGLEPETRARVQDAFMQGGLDVVVATSAFGMGVDKPDIRLIVEETMPSAPEAFYQEAGRAGRDGKPARAVLLFDARDRAFHEMLQERDALSPELLRRIGEAMLGHPSGRHLLIPPGAVESATGASETQVRVAFSLLERLGFVKRLPDCGAWVFLPLQGAEALETLTSKAMEWIERYRQEQKGKLDAMVGIALSGSCRRRAIRTYFGERDVPESCGSCDMCRGESKPLVSSAAESGEEGLDVRDVLSFVAGLPEALGRRGLIQALRSPQAPQAQMRTRGVRALVNRLIEADLLQIYYRADDRRCSYPLLRLSAKADALLDGGRPVRVRLEPAAGRPLGRRSKPRPGSDPQAGAEVRRDAVPQSQPEPRQGSVSQADPEPLEALPAQAGQGPIQMLRCGAFYEFRRHDAETAAALLGLKLGRRGKGGSAYALTGVPLSKGQEAAERLQAQGYSVRFLRKSRTGEAAASWIAEELVPR
jgi:ATP-dependent DNA helicase RecQ